MAPNDGARRRALTLWPEWAYAIVHLGKRVENRGWMPRTTLIGQPLAIHAGKAIGGGGRDPRIDVGAMLQIASDAGHRWDGKRIGDLRGPQYNRLLDEVIAGIRAMSSAVVCISTLAGVLPKRPRNFHGYHAPDSYGWKLENVIVLQEPVTVKGARGLWLLPDDVLACVREQLGNRSGQPLSREELPHGA